MPLPGPTPASDVGAQRKRLLADALKLQFKLWIEAARDLALSPVTLAAAALDFVLARRQPPQYFQRVLEFAHRSDRWIDLWGAERRGGKAGAVDSVLDSVAEVLRDPEAGARRARVLRRWAERQAQRARRRMELPAPPP